MSEYFRQIVERFGLPQLVVGVLAGIAGLFIIALGFDFDVNETLEVIVAGGVVLAAMGAFAGMAWGVGYVLDMLDMEEDR
jgi:uncharacterized membrane protein YjjP (DUF1212 family)